MKSVIITGGAGGMGRAVALKLAQNGYFVYSLDIRKNEQELDNICQVEMDVCKQESIDNAFKFISTKTDSVDAIIHFAGIILMNSLVEISEEDFLKIFNINFFGVYRVNKTFLPFILKNKGKIIITTSELASIKIIPFNSIYSITKKALDAYAEGLRMELALLGIKVITLRPGAVATDMITTSNNTLDKMVSNTTLYKNYTANFKKIVDGEQSKTIPASKIGDLVLKIMNKKHIKYVYTKNASLKLKCLNLVPAKTQIKIYKFLLK